MPVVIKYGGNAMVDVDVREAVSRGIAAAARAGAEPVVVHGGGPFIEAELSRRGIDSEFVRGLRVTTPEALEAVETALTLLGKRLAQQIGNALGLSGRDAGLLLARTFDPRLGRVGRVDKVNDALLRSLLTCGVVPVVACLALDEQGEALNVNADEVAGAVAAALGSGVVFLTNVPGVLDDPDRPETLIPRLGRGEVEERIADGRISGGMIPKVEAALTALALGAGSASISQASDAEGVAAALAGRGGTLILP